jgi:hypothetical protein
MTSHKGLTAAAPDVAPAADVSAETVGGWRGRLGGFLLVAVQLALVLVIVRRFDVAERNHFFPVLCVAVVGYLVHAWLPSRLRLEFFALLSVGTVLAFLGWPNGGWVVGLGGGLIAVCYLPIPLILRVTLIGLAALVLTMARVEYDAPFWPLLGSMFMFRIIVYLFEQRRASARPPLALTLAYFFPLPNVSFLFFPILDFKTFRDTYRSDAPWTTAQFGVAWIARGLMHLLLYRAVKYFLLPAPNELGDLPHLALFLAANYALYLHVSGYFHIITGILRLFGFELPRTHHNYFLADGVTDIWRRINVYWKDFMSTVFFMPAFFALRRLGTWGAVVAAALCVFLMTWLLHAYQVFWMTGGLPLRLYDAGLWLVVGVIVAWQLCRDVARARKPDRREVTGLSAAGHCLRVVGTFALVSLFWGAWNAPAVLPFLRVQLTAGPRAVAGGAVVLGVLLAVAAAGTVAQLTWHRLERLRVLPLQPSPGATGLGLAAALSVVAVLGSVLPEAVFDTRTAAVVTMLRRESATPVEDAVAVQGYYEEMTAARVRPGFLLAQLEGRPAPRKGTHYPEMTRPADAWLERELIPGWTGEALADGRRLTINRFGMRDRPNRTLEKPPGTSRLAVVGSSIVMGFGVGDDETFPWLLEDRLNADPPVAGCRYEVLNFGTGMSHAIHRHVLIDRKVFTFSPDAIYYVAHQDELLGPVKHLAALATQGVALPYPCLADVTQRAGVGPGMPVQTADAKLEPFANDIVRGVYRDLVDECRRRGVLPVWVYLPIPGVTNTPAQASAFADLAREAGFTVTSLDGWADRYPPADVLLSVDGHHPNPLGQRLIARRLDEALRQRPDRLPPRK